MPNTQQLYSPNYYFTRKYVKYMWVSGVITLVVPVLAHAEPEKQQPMQVEFDSDFLVGDAKSIDLSRFKNGNPVLPGDYNVDVYVNGSWFGKRRMTFVATSKQENAFTCFKPTALLEYGVKEDYIKNELPYDQAPCKKIEEWVDSAYYEFDTSRLRVDISIPQVAIKQNAQGYVDPSVWDRGIDAAFLSYNASAYTSSNGSGGNSNNAYMSINAGLNLAGWQFRHNGQWTWRDDTGNSTSNGNIQGTPGRQGSRSDYQATSTYAQRAMPSIRSVLTMGDSFTNGEVFDSIGYRGVDLSSDDRMLPNSMLGYAPQVRGIAKTNAKVEIRQQGQLIYQTSVAAGKFEINDLYPTGFGGELEVTVLEANGEIQRYSIPYSSVTQMLRPGMIRYSLTAGQFRDQTMDYSPWVAQAKYQRGINNYLTAYGGAQLAEHYQAGLLGAAFATPIGAVALDVTHSSASFERSQSSSGQSYRLSYSKLIAPTSTNFTLAAYRYSTEGFYRFRDAAYIRDLEAKRLATGGIGKQRSEFQITLNQGLPAGWGNLYMVGSWSDYWNRSEQTRQYQIGYSNAYHGLTYGLSATKRSVQQVGSNVRNDDTQYLLTLSVPLVFKKNTVNLNTSYTQDSRSLGLSGTVDDRFDYGVSASHQNYQDVAFNANAQYRTNYATVGGSYSIAGNYQQAMLRASGSMVAHAGGVLFGPEQGQTMALVYAPDAAGAKVTNAVGLSVNKSGYAVVPYVTPYRLNDITLDPQGISQNVELEQTSQRIAPFAGAIARVDFSTKTGHALLIKSSKADGSTLPFAAQVYDDQAQVMGMVAQGSQVYLRTQKPQGTATVRWGDAPDQQCRISYDATQLIKANRDKMVMLEAACQ